MKPEDAKSAFEKHLQGANLQIAEMTPAQGVDAMLTFYRDERADDCSFDDDADMLLFQWGTYDWGDGEFFELNMTRQLIFDGFEDESIWQLSLTFKFNPTDAHRSVDDGNKWCGSLNSLPYFEDFVRDSEAFRLVSDQDADKLDLNFGCSG